MADPTPSNGLPESEYVELYNRTLFPVDLNGWSFKYGSSEKTFPPVIIFPHEYLILTGDSLLNSYGTCVNIFSSNSALSNEGTTLILKNASGKIIHSVAYSSDWYQNSLKENGGWSLEMIDPDNPCGCQGNWKASINTKGGTPGSINSVHASNPDDNQPFIKRAGIISDSTILLEFSEPMDSLSLNDLNQWALNGFTPIKVSPIPPGYISVLLTLHESLEKHIIYYLSCRDNLPEDCAGNSLDTIRTVRVGLPDSILPGDIVINEILPNPETGAGWIAHNSRRGCTSRCSSHRRLSVGGSQHLVRASVAVLTIRGRLSTLGRFGVQTVRVSCFGIRMALSAGDLPRRALVDQSLHILVAIHAGEHLTMNRML